MLGKRLINTTVAGGACTTDTLDLAGIPAGSCVAYYKLDSTAADVTGNYDGTPTNVNYTNSGQFSQAAVFNGSSSIFYVNSFDTTTNFSISLWFKSSASSYQVLANNGGSEGGKIGFNWRLTPSGKIELATSSGGGNFNGTPSSLSYNDGDWHNAVLNYASNGVYSIYVDNQSVVSETSSLYTGGAVASRPFAIGAWTQLNQYWFNGSIDQVRIYNQPLSQANVETLYNEVQCPCTTDTVDYPTTNAAYYKLDGNAQDSTTNGYDGVATNVTYNTGKFGQAGVFNGSSSFISGINPVFNTTTYSVSLWFNIPLKGAGYNHFPFIINNDQHLLIYENANGTLGMAYSDFTSINSFYTLPSGGTWNNVVFTRTGNNLSFYVDGVFRGTFSYTGLTQGTGFKIGTNHVNNAWLQGSIDQVRIFDTTLTADQVTDLYDEVYCVP